MLLFLKLLVLLIVVVAAILVMRRTNRLARAMQKSFIRSARESQNSYSPLSLPVDPEQFEVSFQLQIFKLGIVFLSLMAIVMAYSILFGPGTFNS